MSAVDAGLARLPEGSQGDFLKRYLSVYLDPLDGYLANAQEIRDAILYWQTKGGSFTWVIELIGETILNQPRPDNFTDDEYIFILQARTYVRVSSNTAEDVHRLVEFLSRGEGFTVEPIVPRHWDIGLGQTLQLTDQWKELYRRMITDGIGQVDGVTISFNLSPGAGQFDACLWDECVFV